MRSIQLAQHLAQHIPEVVLIINIRQETAIVIAIAFPVNLVQILYIELILNLAPDVVEQVSTLLIRTIVEYGLEVNVLSRFLSEIQLLDTTTRNQEQVIKLLVGLHSAAANTLYQQLGLILAQVVYPQVSATFERGLIIQCVALQYSIAHTS